MREGAFAGVAAVTLEAERGCGYRRAGGLYLVGGGFGVPCDRLPVPVAPCEACGFAPSQTRSFEWVAGAWLGDHRAPVDWADDRSWSLARGRRSISVETIGRLCPDHGRYGGRDPVCERSGEARLLMWVGARFYSPASFTEEAERLGVSKRVSELPAGLVLGRTWVLLAHPEACFEPVSWGFAWLYGDGEIGRGPGVFHAFIPRAVELVLHEKEATAERVAAEAARGVSVVIVPDGAADARVSWRPGEERPKVTLEDHAPPIAEPGEEA